MVDGATTQVIEVNNGFFNLYFNIVIEEWRRRCQPLGVEVLYKCGGKLVGEWTRRPSSMVETECQFADDAAVVGETRERMREWPLRWPR